MTKFFINNLIYALKIQLASLYATYVRTEKESPKEPKGTQRKPKGCSNDHKIR